MTNTMRPEQVRRAHTLLIQREALLRLSAVTKPVGFVSIGIHGAVDEILRPFGCDGLSLKLDDEVRDATRDVEQSLTATYRSIILDRLAAVERELRGMGVDLTPVKA